MSAEATRICVRRSERRLSAVNRDAKVSARHLFNFDDLAYEEKDAADDDAPPTAAFRSLMVLNEDWVLPGGGMAEHGHTDAEIFSVVLRGGLRHCDNLGTKSETIKAGDVQFTSAGTGVRHSEMNDDDGRAGRMSGSSNSGECLLFQVWMKPSQLGLAPSYDHRHFRWLDRLFADDDDDDGAGSDGGNPSLLLSETGEEGSIKIHQKAKVWGYLLEPSSPRQHFQSPYGSDSGFVVAASSWTLTEDEEEEEAGNGDAVVGGSEEKSDEKRREKNEAKQEEQGCSLNAMHIVVAQVERRPKGTGTGGAEGSIEAAAVEHLESLGAGDTAFVDNTSEIAVEYDPGDGSARQRYFLLLVIALGKKTEWKDLSVEEKWHLFQETQKAKQRALANALT